MTFNEIKLSTPDNVLAANIQSNYVIYQQRRIFNRDALWSVQDKEHVHYLKSRNRWRNTPYRKTVAMNVFFSHHWHC